MELKGYQIGVINDLSRFMDIIQETKDVSVAYNCFWQNHDRTPCTPELGKKIEPYANNVPGCPHICMKVPTAGGKTLIASASLKVIFDHYNNDMYRAVVWLVPSDAILSQTLKNLKDTSHPYRQRINVDFAGKVEVFSKDDLLHGVGLSVETLNENLCIFVLSYDSIRTSKKEGRKVYQDNGQLIRLASMMKEPSTDAEVSAMKVLESLNPVVIVDESHNAKSDLSIQMLKTLHPSFILDLTATPTTESNLISIVPAIELKKAHMVKLPVIVVNHAKEDDVIDNAIGLQKNLEEKAMEAYKSGRDRYIRPIVLLQAQPNANGNKTTFDDIKDKLKKRGIPEEQIKIKTAEINELKNVLLTSETCSVRFIITVNALKEGWDCPFAYILASTANRNSVTDVTQILGRVLRLPYTHEHSVSELNLSYVLTSSNRFLDTVEKIATELNNAGFSDPDKRLVVQIDTDRPEEAPGKQPTLLDSDSIIGEDDIKGFIDNLKKNPTSTPDTFSSDADTERGATRPDTTTENPSAPTSPSVDEIVQLGRDENDTMKKDIKEAEDLQDGSPNIPPEVKDMVITAKINPAFKESADSITIPQFCTKEDINELFGPHTKTPLFEANSLLEKFKLSRADINIDFSSGDDRMYQVDFDETNRERLSFVKIKKEARRNSILQLMQNQSSKGQKEELLISELSNEIGSIYPISDMELRTYLKRIVGALNPEEFDDMARNIYASAGKIKEKIKSLSDEYKKEQFKLSVERDEIELVPTWKFSKSKTLREEGSPISKSLYNKEESFNGFERDVINEVANLDNVEWWTRNAERKDFCINGFINHYPDFIIKTRRGKIILLETKGAHLDATDKIELGEIWARHAGPNYRYYLVYENKDVAGSYTLSQFLKIMENL